MDKGNIEDILALTPMQKGMLFHYLKEMDSAAYFEQLTLDISGEIDVKTFEKAWNFVTQTNEMLRAVFRWEKLEKPAQIILREHKCQISFYDLSGLDDSRKNAASEEIKTNDRREPFDLQEVPFRIILCKLAAEKHEMVISNHHILFDGWSNGIILGEFFNAYNDLYSGKESVKPAKARYKEFIRYVHNRDMDAQEKFWQEYLSGFDTQTELSIKKVKKIGKTSTGECQNYRFRFGKDFYAGLMDFVNTHKVTLAAFLYAAWGILLQKYNNADDSIFGTTVSGRSAKVQGVEGIAGLFINTIPLRVRTLPGEKIEELLYRINNALKMREEYEHTPLVNIKEYSGINLQEELFDAIVVIENYPLDRRLMLENSKLFMNSYTMVESTHYDLTVGITVFDEILVDFSYKKELFDEDSMVRLGNHFRCAVEKMVENPGKLPEDIDLISGEEKKRILFDFNDTDTAYPKEKTIHRLFEEQVEKTPDRTATIFEESRLTYRGLDEESNRLARLLRARGANANKIVGLMPERSNEMIIGMLGILKAGGVYVPIGPEYPAERIEYILKECGIEILLTGNNEMPLACTCINLNNIEEDERDTLGLPPVKEPTGLMYIIYTSGTTGKPKGVMIEHRSFVNFIKGMTDIIPFTGNDVILSLTTLSFDIMGLETILPLVKGSRVVIGSAGQQLDPCAIASAIEKEGVTIFQVTPSRLQLIMSHSSASKNLGLLKFLLVGGEAFPGRLLEQTREIVKGKIYNVYGPTETTVWSTVKDVTGEKPLNIGKPIANTRIYILSGSGFVQPLGIPGELCIAGAGVAGGYFNNNNLTKEKFKANPFVPGEKMYKTGDLAKWLPGGNIEFIGRMDHQVKIRGFRIELGEIEGRLLTHDKIKEAVVLVKEDKSEQKYLCAYIVFIDGLAEKPVNSELEEFLSHRLPAYMVPSYFMEIEKIPLTQNGKINRKELPEPEIAAGKDYMAPRDEIEKKLAEIWQDILSVGDAANAGTDGSKMKIGIEANFFRLGGHSLKAVQLISRIHKEINVRVPLDEIFERPTILRLSEYIRGAQEDTYAPVEIAEKKEFYRLSSSQERMYILQQMDPAGTVYNIFGRINLAEDADRGRLERTFAELIRRHESLRTSFEIIDGEPAARLHEDAAFALDFYAPLPAGLTAGPGDSFVRPFDLGKAPLLRVGLMAGPENSILLVDIHHIISDGVSLRLLAEEFNKIYKGDELPVSRLQYKDYVKWQESLEHRKKIKEQEIYWLHEFSDDIPVLDLITDYPRPAVQSFEGDTVSFELSKDETGTIRNIARETGTTLFMVILSIYNILLSKLSGQDDIVIGTPAASRRHEELQRLIGVFVNTLALRNSSPGNITFAEFLGEVKRGTLKAFENQEYQFEDLVDKLPVERNPNRNPIFDVMFNLVNRGEYAGELTNHDEMDPYTGSRGISKFDMTLTAVDSGEYLCFAVEYCSKLFKPVTIERYAGYFRKIISALGADIGQEISDIEIISAEEKERLLYEFNNTGADYPQDKTIHELFAEQAAGTPGAVSLVGTSVGKRFNESLSRDIHITYGTLNEKSDRLARLLRRKGVGPDRIVGIMVERSLEMIAGILGILKSGGAYMPIDTDYPGERIRSMLEDGQVEILLTREKLAGKYDGYAANLDVIDLESDDMRARARSRRGTPNDHRKFEKSSHENKISINKSIYGTADLENVNRPQDLVYVIYTSGSTGKPKGIMVEHRSLVNLCTWHNRVFNVTGSDNAVLYANFCFDASVWELFPYLIKGSTLRLIGGSIRLDAAKLNEYYHKHDISISFLPTQLFEQFIRLENNSLRILLTGADKLNTFIKKRYRLINNYGPTENTVVTTSFVVDKNYNNIPIGKPVANTGVYILDSHDNLLPAGAPGELCIAGDGLTRGYLNDPELTNERFASCIQGGFFEKSPPSTPPKTFLEGPKQKFCSNFFKSLAPGDIKLYKTGDLARWLPDGSIEFRGRVDRQVKLRGFRIELGEIETRLLSHDKIKEAVVIDRDDETAGKYLCAYITVQGTEPVGGDPAESGHVTSRDADSITAELREYLSRSLPAYMIPSYFVELDKIPLTPNGKVDRKVLPGPEMGAGVEYIAPGNELERKLADIWSGVLHVNKDVIGIDSNFFELGGHSLKATILTSRIHKELDVKVPLVEIFARPTIRALTGYLQYCRQDMYASINPAEKKEYYELSSTQKRLYILQQMEIGSTTYNIPGTLDLNEEPGMEKLEKIFAELIERHESFRTSFEIIDGVPVQRIHEKVEFRIENYNFAAEDTGGEIQRSFIRAFDLSNAPLLRLGLTTAGEKKVLLVDMHHIISDGTSIDVLKEEFQALYAGEKLPVLRLQYKDYSEWQKTPEQQEKMKEQGEYYLEQFSDEFPVLTLPIDYKRPTVQDFRGSSIHFRLDREEAGIIRDTAEKTGTTLYMVLLSIYNILLSGLSGQEDIIIGTPVAARRHVDLYRIIGMFANTLVLRNFPGGDKTFLEFLNRVKTRTLEAFDNQEYQFEDLVDRLSIKRDAGRNPIFDAAFSLLDRAGYAGDNRVYHENAAVLQGNTARFDITLIGTDTGNDLLFTFEYRSALFKPATIERFIKYFRKIILELSVNTGQKIGGIEIISEAEKERLLYDFNDTKTGYPQDKTLHELFEEQAERSPAGTALVGSGQAAAAPVEKGAAGKKEKMHITYDVLNEKAGRLARSLKEKGIPAGSIVGIKIKRSIEMMAGIMGILKAGCAYLPIDPEYPEERIRFMQDDCGVKLTISAGDLTEDVETLRSGKVETVFAASRSAGLSYIIYTSGSTGQPKGVMVEHRNVSRVVKNTNYIDIRPQDIILQLSNYAFDGSMFDIFGALLNGASLVILAEDELLDIDKLSTVIEKEKITVFFLTTALFNVLVDTGIQCLGWTRSILFGGERVSVAHVKKALDYLGGGGRVIHMYGPTETVVYATYYPIHRLDDASATIPIGSPLANTTAYILDKYMKPVPIGVPGEIYIGGDSVSRGYLNDPELTAERFAPGRGHHVAGDKAEGMKLYKTGDLARRLPDGNIEFLERIDHQVKLRGFRVELGEIESRLSKDDAIKEALVSVKQDGRGEKCLCAYIVPDREERGEAAVDIPGIKKRLSQTLPGYMIPSYFVPLEKIPLNPNGKVDKKALPEPVMGAGEEYIAPANEIEKKLVEIWADVLNIDENVIGRDANFFELGGHSLNATLLLSKIHKELKVKISLADLFEMQSVEELASVIGIENWVIDQKTVEGEVMDEVVL